MSVKLSLKIGRTPVIIEGDTLKDCFNETELLCQLPQKCGNCESDNITPGFSHNSGYDFYFLKCQECNHELKIGVRKSDNGLFPKFDEGIDGWVPPFGNDDKPKQPKPYGSQGSGNSARQYKYSDQREDDARSTRHTDDPW